MKDIVSNTVPNHMVFLVPKSLCPARIVAMGEMRSAFIHEPHVPLLVLVPVPKGSERLTDSNRQPAHEGKAEGAGTLNGLSPEIVC